MREKIVETLKTELCLETFFQLSNKLFTRVECFCNNMISENQHLSKPRNF